MNETNTNSAPMEINQFLADVWESSDSATNEAALRAALEAAGFEIHRSGYGTWYMSRDGYMVRISDHKTPANSHTRPLVCDEPDEVVIVKTMAVTWKDGDLLDGVSEALDFFNARK